MFDSYDNLPLFHWLFQFIFNFGCIINNQIEFHLSQFLMILLFCGLAIINKSNKDLLTVKYVASTEKSLYNTYIR